MGYGGLRSVTGDWSVMPRVYWLEICGQSRHRGAGVRGGTLEQQPPQERGHRSVAPYSEFINLPWVPRGGISSKSGLCVSPVGKGSEHRDAFALGGETVKGPRHRTGPVLLTLFPAPIYSGPFVRISPFLPRPDPRKHTEPSKRDFGERRKPSHAIFHNKY